MRQFLAIVKGVVQGVNFRMETRETALRLDIAGSAQNLPDGSVRVVARGEEEKLEEFLNYLRKGPRIAIVQEVLVAWDTQDEAPDPFTILY
jgi:acylphosphatase